MYKKLSMLNGLAIAAVVLNHAASWGETCLFWWTDRYKPVTIPNYDQMNSLSFFVIHFIHQATYFCVPAFLFVSGYFFTGFINSQTPSVCWKIIKKRILTIAVPFVIWTAVTLLLSFAQGRIKSLTEFAWGIYDTYSFIPILVLMLLLSPLFLAIAKRNWRWLVAITIAIQVCLMGIMYVREFPVFPRPWQDQLSGIRNNLLFAPVFFFPFGMICALNANNVKNVLVKYKKYFLLALLATLALSVLESQLFFRNTVDHWFPGPDAISVFLYSNAFILCYLAYGDLGIPFANFVKTLGSHSLGIYLTQDLILEFFARAIYHIAPWLLGSQIIFMPIMIGGSIGCSLLAMSILVKSPARKYYHYVFG